MADNFLDLGCLVAVRQSKPTPSIHQRKNRTLLISQTAYVESHDPLKKLLNVLVLKYHRGKFAFNSFKRILASVKPELAAR